MTDIRSEAITLLKSLNDIVRVIERLQEQIDSRYSRLTSTTIKPKEVDVQTSGPADQMAENIADIIEYQKKLVDYQSELNKKKMDVLDIIKQMDISQQELLICRYLRGMTIEATGEKCGISYYWAWQKIHEAENSFCDIYEKTYSTL